MVTDGPSVREVKRMQTRERLLGAAMAEFKRAGMAEADVSAIVTAAGVAHGTFYFHFPTKEHVLLELENREEDRIAAQLNRFADQHRDLAAILAETVRRVLGLERRLGQALFRDLLALHFSQTRPPVDDSENHAVIVLIAREIGAAQDRGEVGAQVQPMNSAVFFLLGLYALLTTMNDWANRDGVLADFLARTLDSVRSR
ncbi:TetR/AcrR family transcriptional regulator [Nocardia sp. alder85J]|uniref:TetR/AcrR family transcriptional regulator n=1 Tax=Nocardia sp. alder85J TaxID=2862949 RepID=UPI001CD30142|nr:TetR/AcrR family transcriptional regulator [Nocardia sp. alder85J]MCX4091941.1 helix-turn-helix domain containing protein [Nocardia sp. alder85J]